MEPGETGCVFRFDSFEVDTGSGELRSGGIRVPLQEKPFQMLVVLLENAGRVVSREQLRSRLWPADVHVGFDHGLSNALQKLREALGDSAENPRFIETLARRGYRFLPAVECVRTGAAPGPASRRPSRLAWFAALGAAVALAGAFWLGARWISGSQNSGPVRVAVLPFQNLSGDPEQEYLADGLTDELILHLGRAAPRQLAVVARTSSMAYKKSPAAVADIARALDVPFLLEGSVKKEADRIRVTTTLVRAGDASRVWSTVEDGTIADVLQAQVRIAARVAESLRPLLVAAETEPRRARAAANQEAWEAYLRGRFFWNQKTAGDLQRSLKWFREAMRLQPDLAEAYAGAADACHFLGALGVLPATEAYACASEYARKALDLDAGLAEAYVSLAETTFRFGPQGEPVEEWLLRALELNPSSAQGRHWYGSFLAVRGRREEGLEQLRLARRLDPLSAHLTVDLAALLHETGQRAEAMRLFDRTLELEPDFPKTHYLLGLLHQQEGNLAAAVERLRRAVQLSPETPKYLAALGEAYSAAGMVREAEQSRAELQRVEETLRSRQP